MSIIFFFLFEFVASLVGLLHRIVHHDRIIPVKAVLPRERPYAAIIEIVVLEPLHILAVATPLDTLPLFWRSS